MSDTDGPRHELNDDPLYEPEQDMLDARHDEREAVEQAAMVAGQLEQEHVEHVATRVARRESRRYGLWGAVFTALIAIGVSLLAVSVANRASSVADQATISAQSAQSTVDGALAELKTANEQLQARGQEPVQVPANPDPSDAIQAAVLAKVLAQLPKAPTAEQVAAVLQPAVFAQVTGPTRDQLAALVADYFAQNPTTSAIQAAVDNYLAIHPLQPGPKGDTGRDGDKGDKGDSPPCLEEASACRGADGANGADSTVQGPQGLQGAPPNSWTWPDPLVPGVTHSCTRSGGTDDAADFVCD